MFVVTKLLQKNEQKASSIKNFYLLLSVVPKGDSEFLAQYSEIEWHLRPKLFPII